MILFDNILKINLQYIKGEIDLFNFLREVQLPPLPPPLYAYAWLHTIIYILYVFSAPKSDHCHYITKLYLLR